MLKNTIYRLETEKKLRIGFFGGSITDGTGSTNFEKTSYRARVTDWFRNAFPESEIIAVNAAIGGTGTGYGMFRCQADLLSDKPDLVFVEFAANDWGDSYENVLPQAESIFRQIRRADPYTDAVAVFSVYDDIAEEIELGIEYESRSAITTAAHHYGVPTVDAGAAFLMKIIRAGGIFSDFIPDTLHPNDKGHKIMADTIIGRLSAWMDKDRAELRGSEGSSCGNIALTPRETPKLLCETTLEYARLVEVTALENLRLNGFTVEKNDDSKRFNEMLEATHAGDSFSFTFKGRGFGFCWGSTNINGNVKVEIDGGDPVIVQSWDHYVRCFHRLRSAIVTTNLDPEKTHSVTVTAEPFQPTEQSPDEAVRIGSIFMC